MSHRSNQFVKLILDGFHVTRTHRLAAPWTRGIGAIFMLHQVAPPSGEAFEPSRILQVTPEFLEHTIGAVRASGYDILSLDEAHQRIVSGGGDKPFVCFTLDDGYRDNLTNAMPVFRAHDVPFTIYLPDRFADGEGDLWWLVLEEVIRRADEVAIEMPDEPWIFDTATLAGKNNAHREIYWWLRGIKEDDARNVVRTLALEHGVDGAAIARTLLMTWDEVRTMNTDPLVTIGAHTSGHFALAKLTEDRMRSEVATNLARLEEELGERPAHFSYPYGCQKSAGLREFDWVRALGMKTAVTTRKGMVFGEHAEHLTALPRFSLNGDFQNPRHLEVLLSGVPFALLNKGRRLNVA